MKIGNYECYALDLGDMAVDGGTMFGLIPKTLWEKQAPSDEKNRIHLKTRSLLIKGEGRNILVDVGYGSGLPDHLKKDYGILHEPMDINLLLSGYDLDVHQITDVVLSHLHFDHAGGATQGESGRVFPTFPEASYYIQSEQWESALNPPERERESLIADNFLPLQQSRVLQHLQGSLTLFDGLEIMITYGHTVAQQHVLVKGEERSLFFAGDMIPTAAHIPVPWTSAYDNRPLDFMPEKDYFLRKAVRENWIVFFPHDPHIEAATVKPDGRWMELDEEVKL